MSGAIPSWAKVGAKVICVEGYRGPKADTVVVGETYTVAGIGLLDCDSNLGLILEEAHNRHEAAGFGYRISRFRPVKTIEDDISEHFAQHLTVRGSAPVEMAS